ncbi:MAG TPA: type VI secretion system protein TssA [Blastocatellia bacterium]|jgi:type VI secretion system protein ImpA
MSSAGKAPIIDIEALLQPIPGDNPAGEDLRYTGLHDEIREARRSEDNLEQGEWKRDAKKADWGRVYEIASAALVAKTKDLQVAAWLSESLMKLEGLRGLRDGLRLMRGLHERFWDGLYPEIEEGDLDGRAQTLEWFDGHLARGLKDTSIAKSQGGAGYVYLQLEDYYQKIKTLNQIEDADERAHTQQMLEQWSTELGKAREGTPVSFYEDSLSLLNECWAEYGALDGVMDQRFGKQTPGLSTLKHALENIRAHIENVVKAKGGQSAQEEGGPGPDAAAASVGAQAVAAHAGPIRTRQDALNQLYAVAEYFRTTEPHSPVSYLVQRAIKWGQMPLDAWLQDVIKNDGVLDQLRETLGLKKESEDKSPE